MPTIRPGIALFVFMAVVACGSPAQTSGQTVGRVLLEVSGGITGWDRILTVESDGTARIQVLHGPTPAAGSRHVEPTVLARLHSLVSDPGFARLDSAYVPSSVGADLQDYVVTAEVGGRSIKTMSRDGANPPPILREVLGILNGILATF